MDPPNRPGLAHFHEHMLFLGTKKYEDDYDAYISERGGSSNAYTDMEDTNYYFGVMDGEEDGFEGALDRLAQFFICPTFSSTSISSELLSVDSEYSNSLTSDSWRLFQLSKHLSNGRHPYSKFGCGNYKTLTEGGDRRKGLEESGTTPRPDLLKFWSTYYHASNFALCVLSRSSLPVLSDLVTKTFSTVPAKPKGWTKPKLKDEGVMPFDRTGVIREYVPVKELRKITLTFPVPPLTTTGDSRSNRRGVKAHRVASHLVGYEGKGSLREILVKEGWAKGVTAGIGTEGEDFCTFSVTIGLTTSGSANADSVLSLFFQWLSLLTANFDSFRQYHTEQQRMSEMFFTFSYPSTPTDFVSHASEMLFKYAPEEILTGPSLMGDYDEETYREFMECLKAENAIITISDPGFAKGAKDDSTRMFKAEGEWETEPYYKACYRQSDISDAAMDLARPKDIDERMEMPAFNIFIPTDFDIIDEESGKRVDPALLPPAPPPTSTPIIPTSFDLSSNFKVYHATTTSRYRSPKTSCYVHLTSPLLYYSPMTMTLCRIFERVLREDLNVHSYDASLAGCNFNVGVHPTGFRIVATGFSQKLPELLQSVTKRIKTLLTEMSSPNPSPELSKSFEVQAETLLTETQNFALDPPYEIASYNLRLLLEERVWHIDEYAAALKSPSLTMAKCAEVVTGCLMDRVDINALVMGNVDEGNVKKLMEGVKRDMLGGKEETLLYDNELPQFRSVQIPTEGELNNLFNDPQPIYPVVYQEKAKGNEGNCAVEYYLQAGCDDDLQIPGTAYLELLSHIAYTSAYATLRTKEQLGYIVSAFFRKTTGGGVGLSISVQSRDKNPKEIQDRIEEWLKTFRKELEEMPSERIEAEGAAVVAQLTEKDTRLSHSVGRAWGEISAREGTGREARWNRLEEIADVIRKRDGDLKEELLKRFDEWFVDPERRRVAAAWVWGAGKEEGYEEWKGKDGVLSTREEVMRFKRGLRSLPNAGLL